jgi:Holliday junction resolvase RusA-like endonuclease
MAIRQSDITKECWAKLTAAAGVAPKPKRPPPDVRTRSSGRWSITLTLACRVVSEANRSRNDHWVVKKRRGDAQREALANALRDAGLTDHTVPLPVLVTWVRVGRQVMDTDNLAGSAKALRDAMAKWIGVDDGDTDSVKWSYEQRSGDAGVEVRIENLTTSGR